jgi:hypothetical protein
MSNPWLPGSRVGLRRLLGWLFAVCVLGAGLELVLVEHTEGVWQLAPLIVLGLAIPAQVAASRHPVRWTWGVFLGLMALHGLSALVGLWLHYRANAEFELEMYPDLAGMALLLKAIKGASPPSLAPGAMLVVGLIGWAWAAASLAPLSSREEGSR